jgi:alginate O-acetyltransferase complex protein AlgJ
MNRVLVILFVVLIALPLAGNLVSIDGGDPAAENRELAAFPTWNRTVKSTVEFPDAFSRWFEDHFAFRAALVRWSGEARMFVLGVSPSTAVVKGGDGWLYYADDGGMDDFANAKAMTASEVDAWRETIVRTRHWLHQQHIAYVFTIAPDKHVIYPEHLPATIRKVRPTSRTDQVYAALDGTGVATIDLRPPLLNSKPRERLYYLTDTHWNDRGALVAYQSIIDAVRRQLPAMTPPWSRDDFVPAEREIEGRDLAGMLGLKHVLHETELLLTPKRHRRAHVIDPPGAEPMAELGQLITQVDDPSLPRAVIFRDSFASRLVPFLAEHFSRAVFLWQNDFDANVVMQEHPDVVIQEIVGRHLYGFLASPELVPR